MKDITSESPVCTADSIDLKWETARNLMGLLVVTGVCIQVTISMQNILYIPILNLEYIFYLINIKLSNLVITFTGVRVPRNKGYVRAYPYDGTVERRTNIQMKEDALYAFEHEERHGVKGPSILSNLDYFDLCEGFVPDYLHSVLLGRKFVDIS